MNAHPPGDATRVETAFGTFEVAADEIITFPAGLPGFEECRRFVVLSSRDLDPFKCLQSVEGPSASFLAVDPRRRFRTTAACCPRSIASGSASQTTPRSCGWQWSPFSTTRRSSTYAPPSS